MMYNVQSLMHDVSHVTYYVCSLASVFERDRVCVCVCDRKSVRVRGVCACVKVSVRICVCVREREREREEGSVCEFVRACA